MSILIISLQNQQAHEDRQFQPELAASVRCQRVEILQSLALAKYLHLSSISTPLLLCRKAGALHAEAAAQNLPHLAIARRNPLDYLRLWLWEKRQGRLLILAVGQESIRLGRRVLELRKAETTFFAQAFFLESPAHKASQEKDLLAARRLLCGSDFVRQNILETLTQERIAEKKQSLDEAELASRLSMLAPGMDLSPYQDSAPGYTQEAAKQGCHFVFGMGESLEPDSGALDVIRAMAALWQREDLPPWEVRMFGAGARFDEVRDEALKLGVASRLCILGDQPLPDALSHCHAWLAPGYSPLESPSTLGAGFAAGLPVIYAQSPLHRERLKDKGPDHALDVEANNPQALAQAMIAILLQADLRTRLAEAALSVREDFGLTAMTNQANALFQEWLAIPAPKASKLNNQDT